MGVRQGFFVLCGSSKKNPAISFRASFPPAPPQLKQYLCKGAAQGRGGSNLRLYSYSSHVLLICVLCSDDDM